MRWLKQFFSDLVAMFFLGVGISTNRTKERKLDLRKLVSGDGWNLFNRVASNVQHTGQMAIRFDARPGEGLAWVEGLRFSAGKIDLQVAAIKQAVGIAFRVQDERTFDAICFHVGDEAPEKGEKQSVVVRFVSRRSPQSDANLRAQFELPDHQSGEWFKARITISKQVIAVFIHGNNVPCFSIDNPEREGVYGSVGLWVGAGSHGLVADFRLHEIRGQIEKQIGNIMGKRA